MSFVYGALYIVDSDSSGDDDDNNNNTGKGLLVSSSRNYIIPADDYEINEKFEMVSVSLPFLCTKNEAMAPLHVATLTVKRELPKYEITFSI